MKELILRIFNMDKTARLTRLCYLSGKEITGRITGLQMMEITMIQAIREENGELEEIRKERKTNPL